eukprot:TRINITY_DN24427_c0_g1_i1.p1 TRINITY_DN24427_c0_g1~~TRINITY_DN24427_c0_g1_i1.p1  ORF type:complete len:589 (-),score=126.05 TRINITY_DN24427_c0_g1_i1:27-1793(-)
MADTSGASRVKEGQDAITIEPEEMSKRIQEIFSRFDTDGEGSLDSHELTNVFKALCPSMKHQQLTLYVKMVIGNKGGVSHADFMTWIQNGSEAAHDVTRIIIKETGDAMANSLREVFARFDSDGGGFLDKDELSRVFRTFDQNLTIQEVDALCKEVDKKDTGKVSLKKFLRWLKAGSEGAKVVKKAISRDTGHARDEKIKKAFQQYDATGDGSLDIDEMRRTLKTLGSFSSEEVRSICADLDKSGDGEIDLEEFSAWMKDGSGAKEIAKAKAILAPGDSDGLEAVFFNFCGAGHTEMSSTALKRLCKDCDFFDKGFDAAVVDLIFADGRVRDKNQKCLDYFQFEVALELIANRKGMTKAEIRQPLIMQGAPKPVPSKAVKSLHIPGVPPIKTKKPERTAIEKRIAAILRKPVNEVEGQEAWRREVDNSEMWRIFGLSNNAGIALKNIYAVSAKTVSPPRSRPGSPGSRQYPASALSPEASRIPSEREEGDCFLTGGRMDSSLNDSWLVESKSTPSTRETRLVHCGTRSIASIANSLGSKSQKPRPMTSESHQERCLKHLQAGSPKGSRAPSRAMSRVQSAPQPLKIGL